MSGRQEAKGFDMTRPQRAEVPMIQRGQLWLVQPLNDRKHSGVDVADIRICVSIAELGDSPMIVGCHADHLVGSAFDVSQQRDQDAGMQAAMDEVIDLDQDGSRDQERLPRLLDELPAASMVVIAAIE